VADERIGRANLWQAELKVREEAKKAKAKLTETDEQDDGGKCSSFCMLLCSGMLF
jgi:hypothetical protein